MNIFITNDDGINAEGIKILAEEISKIANTYVVAPDSPRSASGHAITLHKPILINDEFIAENVEAYSTSCTPADCVMVGIEAFLKDVEIDLVLSGINNGPNLGNDVIYSGTVAAAIEGLIEKKPSIALSCNSSKVSTEEYEEAAKYTVALIQKLEGNLDKLDEIILNVNFPKGDKKGVKITQYIKQLVKNEDIPFVLINVDNEPSRIAPTLDNNGLIIDGKLYNDKNSLFLEEDGRIYVVGKKEDFLIAVMGGAIGRR